tara:strand:- start:718 stop:1191 length:474 start_codon:yes stop_codon:yes gene_type:complete
MRNLKFMNAIKEEMKKNNYTLEINKNDYSEEDYNYIDGCIKDYTGEFLSDSHLCYFKKGDYCNTVIFIQDVVDSAIKFKIFVGDEVSGENWMYNNLNNSDVFCSGEYLIYKDASYSDFKIETRYLFPETLIELNHLSKDLHDIFVMFNEQFNIHGLI